MFRPTIVIAMLLLGCDAVVCMGEESALPPIRLSDLETVTNPKTQRTTGRITSYSSVAFSTDSQVLAASCSRLTKLRLGPSDFSSEVQLFDMDDQPSLQKIIPLADKSGGCFFLDEARRDAVHYIASERKKPDGRRLDVMSTQSDTPLATIEYSGTIITPIAMDWERRRLAICGKPTGDRSDGELARVVSLWDIDTGMETARFPVDGVLVTGIALSPDGTSLAVTGTVFYKEKVWVQINADGLPVQAETPKQRGVLRLWDITTKKRIHDKEFEDHYMWSLAFSPNGKTLVVGMLDCTKTVTEKVKYFGWEMTFTDCMGKVIWWDVCGQNLKLSAELELPRPPRAIREKLGNARVECLAFSPDGRFLAVGVGSWSRGGKWGGVRIIDNESHEVVTTLLEKHSHVVRCVAFSPDGKRLAVGTADGALMFWDVTKLSE